MLLGEGPAIEEYRRGLVFQGKTGVELSESYLPRFAGVSRDDVYVSNISKCAGRTKSGGIDNPTVEQARACWEYFGPREIREVQPDIVVLMGAVAIHAVLGDVDLELQHGIPVDKDYGWGDGRTIIPTYHPASGLHDTQWMIAVQDDFRRVGRIIRGDLSDLVFDEFPNPNYVDVPKHGFGLTLFREWLIHSGWVAIDTESVDGVIHCVTVSSIHGQGAYVGIDNFAALEIVRDAVNSGRVLVIFHNAVADLPKLSQVDIRPCRWVDTMEIAYWCGEFRIGLKTMAYRRLGMRMRDYTDVVGPPSKIRLWEYMEAVNIAMTTAVPEGRKTKSMSDRELHIRSVRRNVRRLTGDLDKEFAVLKPWDRIDKWDPADVGLITDFAEGVSIPRMSIANVGYEEKLEYAVRDADATGRLYPVVRRMASEIRRSVSV